ncbi:SDR family NAD(P)-dependent oxidoreductase [Alphaproteobacteria bacterium]|nr:SDR family NAD(P)-dependent oxidoreductase [Alphaproteobacteria bacterium]
MDQNKKTILITGANGGLGSALALVGAKNGDNVVLLGTQQKALSKLTANIKQSYAVEVYSFIFDANKLGNIEALTTKILLQVGCIHEAYFCHAVNVCSPVVSSNMADVIKLNNVNYLSNVFLTKELIKHMNKNGCGTLVYILSGTALFPLPSFSVYSASKSALRSFSRALRFEHFNSGIRVCQVYPGKLNTNFDRKTLGAEKASFSRGTQGNATEDVAAKIFKAARGGKMLLSFGFLAFFLMILDCIFPMSVDWLVKRKIENNKND